MKLRRMLCLSGLAFACAACFAQPPVAGRWRSLATSQGGIGAMFDFHPDGTLDYSPGAVVESRYRIDGDELILPPATVQGVEFRQTIEWSGENTLRLRQAQEVAELTRQGPRSDPANPIFGEWTGKRDMNGQTLTTHWFFYPGGRSLLLVPFLTQHGKYWTTGTTTRIEMPNRPAVEGPYRLDQDVLSVPGPTGNTDRYARY